ncbi:hypothetical protein QBC34DRAFT_77835 [Podospora aff. communis PSN243]|uniref:Uncharacterized protein n=1 Tax=Podospora aff. communis PSN243 TaxID=3040156 RepID=A0AAV9GRT3_9PEZI|nr:hypothetical protein QBC34DRAFT_77835 [Podospora aff. communis PSN243]
MDQWRPIASGFGMAYLLVAAVLRLSSSDWERQRRGCNMAANGRSLAETVGGGADGHRRVGYRIDSRHLVSTWGCWVLASFPGPCGMQPEWGYWLISPALTLGSQQQLNLPCDGSEVKAGREPCQVAG